jgi:hypothetical protein
MLALTVALAVVGLSCGGGDDMATANTEAQPATSTSQRPTVTEATTTNTTSSSPIEPLPNYTGPGSPDQIAAFCGNPLIVVGELSSIRGLRSRDDPDRLALVAVTDVVRDFDLQGREGLQTGVGEELPVRLRAEGGYGSPRRLAQLRVGESYMFFLVPLVKVGSGPTAATPNVVYRVDAGVARSLDGRYVIPLTDFKTLLNEKAVELAQGGCAPASRTP